MGQIAKTVSKPKVELSHLQREIRRFVITVCSLAFSIAVIIVVVWAAWLRNSYPNFMPPSALLLNIIGSVVAFIPEGLPVAVTLVLTIIAKRMFKQVITYLFNCGSVQFSETFLNLVILTIDRRCS
jgi:sodium/potassium-transporting ATPase subunit alpha